MGTIEWLKRKYPKSYRKVTNIFDEHNIKFYIKDRRYKVAKLMEDFRYIENYKKGTIFIVKNYKVYEDGGWTGEYQKHVIFKCDDGITQSGYHGFTVSQGLLNYKLL